MFYSFASASFTHGERQSSLQLTVALAADQISRELRNASEIAIIANNAFPVNVSENWLYLFLNQNNNLELRQQNSSHILVNAANFGVRFNSLSFTGDNTATLGFTIAAENLANRTQTHSISSRFVAENLRLNSSTIPQGTGAAIRFRRAP